MPDTPAATASAREGIGAVVLKIALGLGGTYLFLRFTGLLDVLKLGGDIAGLGSDLISGGRSIVSGAGSALAGVGRTIGRQASLGGRVVSSVASGDADFTWHRVGGIPLPAIRI